MKRARIKAFVFARNMEGVYEMNLHENEWIVSVETRDDDVVIWVWSRA